MSDTPQPTLLVIDGHSLAFRAFYALPLDSFVTRDGQHTNAIHGFIAMLINLLQQWNPTHLAVAFDISRYSFRTREYPEYKGTRGETPPEFIGQIPLLEEALHAMRITTVSKEDFEADDILATLAKRGTDEGYRVLVVSGDRDTIQLVNENVTLLYPSVRGVSELKIYDPAAVRERYGIEPAQYPEIAALVGETSDNLIGIDKVGEKTAVKWISEYGTVENLLVHADDIKGVVGQKLREQQENARLNRRLNALRTDVDLPLEIGDLQRQPISESAVREVFARLQFRTLLDRLLKISAADGGLGGVPLETDNSLPSLHVPPVRICSDEELAHWLESVCAQGDPIGVHVEYATGPSGTVAMTGVGLATTTETVYVPWKQGLPDYRALEEWFASDYPKEFFHAKPQIKALIRSGFHVQGLSFDARVTAWVIRPGSGPATLADDVADTFDEHLPRPNPNQLVPEDAPLSVATEAWYVRRLCEARGTDLAPGTRSLLDNIEFPLISVLAEMELAGVAIDAAALESLRTNLSSRIDDLQAQAFAVVGHEFNLGSPKQLQQILFDELNMPKTRSTKTGYSTDAAALADLQESSPHHFLDLLLQHRDASKLRQIIETLERFVSTDGRIHTTYDQTGTTTGRISSNDPNLQNIPIRSAEGRDIRATFVTGADYETLLTADYSQIEMRIMAHLSEDPGLIEAFTLGEDLHRYVGSRVFGVDPADVTAEMRSKVKAMSYGLAYGLSAFGLSKQLRIDTSEARGLMEDYFERFGRVRDYLRNVVEQARIDGYTETIFGRRRPFADLSSANRVLRDNAERAALNAPIQGSAADIMKIAMLGIASDLREHALASRMLLQVHDELIFEVAEGERDRLETIVRERMGGAATLRVPLDVQIGVGYNWDAAAH